MMSLPTSVSTIVRMWRSWSERRRTHTTSPTTNMAQQHTETASTSDELKPSSTWMFRRKSTQLTG